MAHKPVHSDTDKIIVGRFASVYGVRGWIRIDSFTEPKSNILDYSQWWVQSQDGWQQIAISEHKFHGEQLIVKLAHCDQREQVQRYTTLMIGVARESLPVLPTDEYYWEDLIGLRVINLQGQELGYIDHIMATGANDVFVVQGERQSLLPYTDEVVKSISLTERLMQVDWDLDYDS